MKYSESIRIALFGTSFLLCSWAFKHSCFQLFRTEVIASTPDNWEVVFEGKEYAEVYYADDQLTPATQYKYRLKAYFDQSESEADPTIDKLVCTCESERNLPDIETIWNNKPGVI